MQIRRVVTGQNHQGKSVIVEDALVDPIIVSLSTNAYHDLWRGQSHPNLPNAGHNTPMTTFFPRPGEYLFFVITIQPGEEQIDFTGIDLEAALREAEEKMPGVLAVNEPENPGMHTTDTVELEIVLSGEIVLELDDGVETTLRAGDANIQNGTRHRWHNRGTEPVSMAVVSLGGTRA